MATLGGRTYIIYRSAAILMTRSNFVLYKTDIDITATQLSHTGLRVWCVVLGSMFQYLLPDAQCSWIPFTKCVERKITHRSRSSLRFAKKCFYQPSNNQQTERFNSISVANRFVTLKFRLSSCSIGHWHLFLDVLFKPSADESLGY